MYREKQVTIGSVIIMSKHLEETSLGALSPEAWSEFGGVCRDIETALKSTFSADAFNYLALMMVDPEVHFHVIPRYSNMVSFAGQAFTDPDWPGATKRVALELSNETKMAIERKLKEALQA